jgi:signal transduction histidine kinase
MANLNSSNFEKSLAGNITLSVAEKLLNLIYEPVCVINPDGKIAFMNQAMLELAGVRETVAGKTFSDLPFKNDLGGLTRQVKKALETSQVIEGAVHYRSQTNQKVVLSFCWTPELGQNGSITMVIGVGRIIELDEPALDLLESKERQSFLLGLSDALRPLSDTAAIQQETTRRLGEYLHADRTYYAACDESRQLAVIERDYVRTEVPSLVGVHHYSDFEAIVKTICTGEAFIADDVTGMPEVQPQLASYLGNQMRALLAMPLMKDGQMVACLAVTSSVARYWTSGEISLLEQVAERTWEAVERGRYENELKRNQQLMSTIFESLPVGVGLIGNDGRVSFSNQELSRYLPENIMPSADEQIASRWKGWDAEEKPLDRDSFPGVRASRGEFVLPGVEMLYTPEDGQEIWTQVAAVPILDPAKEINGLITVITDIDHIKRTTKALREIEQQFRAFVAASSELVYRMSADWQLMYNLSGNGFLKDTPEPVYNWLESYIPQDEQQRVKEAIQHAVVTKSVFKLEHRVNLADGAVGWVISTAIPLLDQQGNITEWLGAANDITLRKTAELQLQGFASSLEQEVNARTQELKESRDQIQSILDTSLMQMSILQAVRDEHGEVTDIEIMLVNKEHERVMGRNDLVGLHYVKEYPGMKKSVLFDLIVKTIETGEPHETEYFYPYENFNSWYASMFVKLNDGVVAFTMDISARKNAEEERFKNYLLLRQSEEMALMGSWDFDLLSGVFSWSDGMYRLFDMKERVEVSPEIYLKYTTDNGRPAAERVIKHIRNGDTNFSETLELNVNGLLKVVQLKASVMRNEIGHPVRVLGVDMDVTASKTAEIKIRQMEAQQQELIFRATLASQEEERRRISESLHNGLGQLLYGIKLSMSHLTAQHALDKPEIYAKDKIYTEELLKQAIGESRRISHELMPLTLEDFGLTAAVNDVCQQLNTNIKFKCKMRGFTQRLDKYMELAVFRIIQELMLNVVKHSGATKATAEASLMRQNIQIKVQDNGQGMAADAHTKSGIGLSSIRSRIKLLNGEVKIDSRPGKGTKVLVRMPLTS